jgi:CubicO group peptidase (beta-lactamase class C family)
MSVSGESVGGESVGGGSVSGRSGAGFTETGLAALHATVAAHVGDQRVPGLVALVAQGGQGGQGGQVHVEAQGSLSIGGPPVARDSLFRIASTTKPFTAAATLALVAEGRLELDEPVDRLLPELADRRVLRRMDGPLDETVPADRPITTRDLLTYTFGFGQAFEMFTSPTPWPVTVRGDELMLHTFGPPDPDATPDPDTWIAALGSLPLLSQPGQRWLYNTSGSVLGVLLARATGQPFGEVLRTRICEPLGLRDTAFFTDHTDRLATAYRPTQDGLVVYDAPDGAWSRPPRFEDGSGGLVSTVDDLLAFARMLLAGGGSVLPAELVRAMCTDRLTAEQKANSSGYEAYLQGRSWGFGQAVAPSGVFGWDGGLGTSWLVDPRHDLTVIVLTQRMWDSPGLPAVHQDIQAAAYAALA